MSNTIKSFFAAMLLLTTLFAQTASAQLLYSEGKDYEVLDNPLPLRVAGQKEVVEFFSYACPHCANLEPHMVKWSKESKSDDVGFYQMPAVGGKQWTFVAQVKFVADKLKLGHEFDQAFFDEIHKKRNRRMLGDKKAVVNFMVEKGADKTQVEKAWDSLQVKSSLKKSAKQWEQAKLSGVPAVIVNGKYLVKLTGYEKFFAVIDFLLSTTDVPK